MFSQVDPDQVLAVPDVSSTYHVPMVLEKQGFITSLGKILHVERLKIAPELIIRGANAWDAWKASTCQEDHDKSVTIALVGKYTSFADSYMSVIKPLEHSAMACKPKLILVSVDSSLLQEESKTSPSIEYDKAWETVKVADGILIPIGFGNRGTEGMIAAAKYAREQKIPFLGIYLGFQVAVIEYARNVCNIPHAGSVECKSFHLAAERPVLRQC
jgi:CTP synthase